MKNKKFSICSIHCMSDHLSIVDLRKRSKNKMMKNLCMLKYRIWEQEIRNIHKIYFIKQIKYSHKG